MQLGGTHGGDRRADRGGKPHLADLADDVQTGGWIRMAQTGEAVVVDGLATRVQRPAGWGTQKVLYDAKRHAHTAQGLAVSTVWGTCCGATGAGPAAATSRRC